MYDNLIFNRTCNRTYNRMSYINKMFSISQSATADSSLYQREPKDAYLFEILFYAGNHFKQFAKWRSMTAATGYL